MATISRDDAIRKIIQTGGKTFSVSFVKKDGSERRMNCRLGVKKHLKGGESTVRHIPNLVTVFEMPKSQYRNINTDTIYQISIEGESFDVVD